MQLTPTAIFMASGIFTGDLFFLLFPILSAVAVAQGGGGAPRELWCVAKNNADDSSLQSALDWTCGPGGADCGPIQNGGPCYDGSDLQRTASYAFNDYYRKNGPSDDNCNFGNTAALTSLNPSHNNCKIPSSLITSTGNFNGSTNTDSGSVDLSSSSSLIYLWDRGSLIIHLLFAMTLVF